MAGQVIKNDGDKRGHIRQTALNDAELEKIEWAAAEAGLPIAVFLRFAALKVAREFIG